MRIVSSLKRFARRGLLLATLTGTIIGGGVFIGTLLQSNSVSAATTPANTFDCDANSVIWCGADDNGTAKASEITSRYNNGDGHNSVADIRGIYSSKWFNISSSDIQNLSKDGQLGTVSASGDVTLNGKVVATDALTAGRHSYTNSCGTSIPETIPGTKQTFYIRKPCVTFVNGNSLYAYIVMDGNDQFEFAILLSCGNPVSATPVPKPKPTPKPTPKTPNYTINKEVAAKGSSDYQKSITAQSGSDVDYRITVDSTGNAAVTNLLVNDTLPQNVAYVSGTLKEDGKTADASGFFAKGVTVGSLNPGASTVFTFEAQIGSNDTVETCQNQTLNNEGTMWATSLPGKSSTATVTKTCAPKPVYACTSLTPYKISDSTYKFTAQASAKNGATITGYNFDFGDKTSKQVATAAESVDVQHPYTAAGTYNVTVSVTIAVNGATQTVTAPACATSVTIPQPPAAECTDLELTQATGNPRQVSAAVQYTATNGATLGGVSFDWNDGTTTPASLQTTADHTYAQDGTYTVKATLTFSVPSGAAAVPDSNCQAPITVTTVPPVCGDLTIDVDNDTKQVTVTGLTYTLNNSTYESTDLNWGDNGPITSDSDITGQQHTYTGDGPYTIVATPHFMVNGVDTPVTSQTCEQTVNFTETPPTTPPTTPPQTPPTQLVNTGAGNVVGLFAAAAFIGIIGYRRFLSRRLGRTDA